MLKTNTQVLYNTLIISCLHRIYKLSLNYFGINLEFILK